MGEHIQRGSWSEYSDFPWARVGLTPVHSGSGTGDTGDELGIEDGLLLGTVLGVELGVILGPALGAALGAKLGTKLSVGKPVGVTLGILVGRAVGEGSSWKPSNLPNQANAIKIIFLNKANTMVVGSCTQHFVLCGDRAAIEGCAYRSSMVYDTFVDLVSVKFLASSSCIFWLPNPNKTSISLVFEAIPLKSLMPLVSCNSRKCPWDGPSMLTNQSWNRGTTSEMVCSALDDAKIFRACF